jgi:hypothetical protein
MPTLDEVYSRKKEASGQVSTQTRTLAFGFLAIAWSLLTVHDDPLKTMAGRVPSCLLLTLATISVLVLVLDMLQYVALTKMAESAYHKAENTGQKENVLYDKDSCAYKAQAFLYHAKFYLLVAGFLALIAIFVLLFLPAPAVSK